MMKTLMNRILLLSIASLMLGSCKKDETKITASDGKGAALTASASTLVLTKANAADKAITFTATAPDYGYAAAVTSTLQFAVKGTNFANPKQVILDANVLSKSFTVIELNALLLGLNLAPGSASEVEVRTRSEISSKIAPVYSNATSIIVTPYALISYLYVPGAYQGWTPATADSLLSATSNGIYEGVINFTPGNLGFKIVTKKSWGQPEYGTGASAGSIAAGGGDLTAPNAGSLKLIANLNDNTLQFVPFSWGLIGNAPVGSDWGGTAADPHKDIAMKYDNGKLLWTVTADMLVGEFKFRLNNDWGTNFGDNGNNGTLEAGGANIPIAEAGTYKFELNLTDNTYTKTKL
jgi:starch-binding outer membrane protein SusE/F